VLLIKVGNVQGSPSGGDWGMDFPPRGIQLMNHHRYTVAPGKGHDGIIASIYSILRQFRD